MTPALAHAWRHVGPHGAVGAALLLAAAVWHAAWVAPLGARRDALAAERPAAQAARGAAEPSAPGPRLDEFWQRLPTPASVPQWVGRIRGAATRSGLALRTVDYKLERNGDAPLARYRITLPVTGRYGQVRDFVAAVLADVPAASVDDVQFKRADGPDRRVEARVRLTLFINTGGNR